MHEFKIPQNLVSNKNERREMYALFREGEAAMNSKTANFRVLPAPGGWRYQFYCALSGALACTTGPVESDTSEKALQIAWESEGKKHFNRCSKCGNWVIDAMYNVDVLECVDCAPFEREPLYCKFCGEKVEVSGERCSKCGAVLIYKGGA